jgi:outer membrane protein
MKKRLLVSLVAALTAAPASAVDLLTVYEQALAYDSELAANRAAYKAQLAASDQTRSTLLPQLNAFGELALTRQDSDPAGSDSFNSTGIGLELTQPLFRASQYFEYRATQKQSQQAEAELSLAQQGLVLDVASAYFNVLRAQDTLAAARAAEAALQRQYEQAQERYDVGLIAVTEVLEARAAFDDIQSQRIAAESEVDIARVTLARLTGDYPEELEKLEQDFPIAPPEPTNPEAWAEVALAQNWEIKAAQFQRLARADLYDAAEAERLPTLDLTASVSRNNVNGALSQFNRDQDNAVIALQLNVPLYSGGGIQAGVRQAGALAEQSQAILETTRRNVALDTRTLFRSVTTNIQSVQALRQSIVSRRSALEATRAGYRVGTRNIVEVLEAEQEYYLALSSYADARYDYVLNSLRLKQAAGILSPQDVRDLNRWLSASAPGIEALARQVQQEAETVEPSQARP